MPFEQYMKQRLFRPLKMRNSTVDSNEILSNQKRAIGHMTGMAKMSPIWSMIGAGLVYTSAADLARFVQLHLNKGTLEGERFLDESLIDAMYTPHGYPGATEPADAYYGLGLALSKLTGELQDETIKLFSDDTTKTFVLERRNNKGA